MANEQGESPNDAGIARALEITVHTVEVTCQRYLQYGLQAVLERAPRKDKGVLQKMDGRVEAQLITLACSGTAANAALEAQRKAVPTASQRLVSGLNGAFGSASGPGGALYVTVTLDGSIRRVDPKTGTITTFAHGLPTPFIPEDGVGVVDVAFIGSTAYALVTLVGPDYGGNSSVGIYRIDGPNSFTLFADIGAFSLAHPPKPAFFVPTGAQYALEPFRGGFLVTDAHHNRVLQVTRGREVSELIAFDNMGSLQDQRALLR